MNRAHDSFISNPRSRECRPARLISMLVRILWTEHRVGRGPRRAPPRKGRQRGRAPANTIAIEKPEPDREPVFTDGCRGRSVVAPAVSRGESQQGFIAMQISAQLSCRSPDEANDESDISI
jgi:hypothetical protein